MTHLLRLDKKTEMKIANSRIAGSLKPATALLLVGGLAIVGLLPCGQVLGAQGLQLTQVREEPSLLLMGSHSHGFLGVDVSDVDQDRAQTLHLKDTHGAEITVLDHDAPAGKAHLKLHDVILQINGRSIDGADQVKQILHQTPPGHKLQMVVSRDGVPQTVTVQLADRRKVQEEAREELGAETGPTVSGQGFLAGAGDVPPGFHLPWSGSSLHVGAMVEPLTPQTSDFLGLSGGVMIKSLARRSAADKAGLKLHDVILEVGGEAVVTSSDWERLLRTAEGRPVQVEILRDRQKQLVLLQVDGKRR
jgi:predicted metalloprotease with PDZ domain